MKRKSTAYIVQAVFLAIMFVLLPTTVWAQETTLTTSVPSGHTMHIMITGEGTVAVDGVAYTKNADIELQRQHRPEISVVAADSSKIKTVLWGSEDITAAFQNGNWTGPEILEDATLTVTFEKLGSTPQTGDPFYPHLWIGLLIFSLLGLMVCLLRSKKVCA